MNTLSPRFSFKMRTCTIIKMYGACPQNAFVCVKFYFSGIPDLNSNADADVSAIFVLRIKQI